jgi:hypothetical protein
MTFEHLDDPEGFVPDVQFRAAAHLEGRRRQRRRRLSMVGGSALGALALVVGLLVSTGGIAMEGGDPGRVDTPPVDPTTTLVVPEVDPAPTTPATSTATTTIPSSTTTVRPSTTSMTSLVPNFSGGADFLTPSGNIGCGMDPQGVRCDVRGRRFQVPPAPDDCLLEWGHGVAVRIGTTGYLECAGDTAIIDGLQVLEYGKAVRVGQIVCESRTTGVTCRTDEGHGFTLSREAYTLF